MAQLTNEEVKVANRERLDYSAREKAKLWAAEKAAAEEYAWYSFLKNHCGAESIKRGDVYFHCTANEQMLLEAISKFEPPTVNQTNLEVAFNQNRDRLANPNPEPYERKADARVSREAVAQRGPETVMPAPPFRLDYTKQEVLDMPADKQRKLMAKGPQYVAELNRILNEE